MHRTVIHIDVTDFRVAVERVLEPRLRGRPVAIAVETTSRSLVYDLSREVARNGVYRGMPLAQAFKSCPDLTVLPPNEDLYLRATTAMLRILNRFSPIIEPLRFGHAYLDMTGTGKLFGGVVDAAAKAQREIREWMRLDANIGVASNKLVSKVASDVIGSGGQSVGLCDVHRGEEAGFLAPLRVGYLPGVQKTVREQLLELNVRLIRELAVVTSENLQMVFGRFGVVMSQRARGIDNRPVRPPKRAPEIVEAETLAEDNNDYDLLRATVYRLLAQATRRLRLNHMRTGKLVIEIRYSDYKEDAAQQRIPSSQDEWTLVRVAASVLERALSRRVRVRKITLRLCDLAPENGQLSLFDRGEDPKRAALISAMDKIRNRYGERAIRFGRAA